MHVCMRVCLSICVVGAQVIEAHYLFGTDYDNIDIVVHPQSIGERLHLASVSGWEQV